MCLPVCIHCLGLCLLPKTSLFAAEVTVKLLPQACTPTPPRRESTPLAVAQVRQEAELAEAEVAAVWAGQLAAALEVNQDLEDNVVRLRQQNAGLKRCGSIAQSKQCLLKILPENESNPNCIVQKIWQTSHKQVLLLVVQARSKARHCWLHCNAASCYLHGISWLACRERKAMEGEVRQMQADMQALVEADLDAQQVCTAGLSSLHRSGVSSTQALQIGCPAAK